MPMSFSLSGLMLISAAYLLVLFAVAWCAHRGLIPVSYTHLTLPTKA